MLTGVSRKLSEYSTLNHQESKSHSINTKGLSECVVDEITAKFYIYVNFSKYLFFLHIPISPSVNRVLPSFDFDHGILASMTYLVDEILPSLLPEMPAF